MLPTLAELEKAAGIVYTMQSASAQYCWPQLCQQLGTEIWVKHENHNPAGSFKVRGGAVYFAAMQAELQKSGGVISATRGNHGQSVGLAARRFGIPATIVVPHGNSLEKNAAMRALGVELLEIGDDFQAAKEQAEQLARERGLHMVPSYHPLLVSGVATYGLELLRAVPDLHTVYVPIGLGSGISAMIAARDALGLKTRVVGVVSAHARAYAVSFSLRQPVEAPVTTQLADGMACRTPVAEALDVILQGAERIVEVTDSEVAAAMRTLFECTHNVCEGAGAAALAAALQDSPRLRGHKMAVVITGGNVDKDVYARVLAGTWA